MPTLWIYVLLLSLFMPGLFISAGSHLHRQRNVVLCIADGLGPSELTAARLFRYGLQPKPLALERMPVCGTAIAAYGSSYIDSATQAVCALWMGEAESAQLPVSRIQGLATPPIVDRELRSIVELAREQRMVTGLVSNVAVSDPVVSTLSRCDEYGRPLGESRGPLWDVFLAGSDPSVPASWPGSFDEAPPTLHGTEVVRVYDRSSLLNLPPRLRGPLVGFFPPGNLLADRAASTGASTAEESALAPSLSEMTKVALDRIGGRSKGFLLVLHTGLVARAGALHDKDVNEDGTVDERDAALVMGRMCEEVHAFDEAVELALAFARSRSDTLVIVTGLREVGGLTILDTRPPVPVAAGGSSLEAQLLPVGRWAANQATVAEVPVWASGPAAESLAGSIRLERIYRVIRRVLHMGEDTAV